jgi:RecB family exonuclease
MELQKHFRGLYPEAPEEDYEDIYRAMTAYNTERFIECIEEDVIDNFIPVGNEIMLNARYTTEDGQVVHLQGIIDRIFYEDGGYIPMELKTGAWKDTKKTMMRKEMAFYKLLFEHATDEDIRAAGLDPDIPFTHWGWYYPASNYVWVEKVSNRSEQAMHRSMKKLLNAYQEQEFDFEYYYKKCIHCGHYDHCEAAAGGSQYEWF